MGIWKTKAATERRNAAVATTDAARAKHLREARQYERLAKNDRPLQGPHGNSR